MFLFRSNKTKRGVVNDLLLLYVIVCLFVSGSGVRSTTPSKAANLIHAACGALYPLYSRRRNCCSGPLPFALHTKACNGGVATEAQLNNRNSPRKDE